MIFGSVFSTNALSTVKRVIHFVHRVARYDLWFLCSVHLDARQNPSRNEIKCGDFWKYFFNQRIINRQARYSFRATSCTLRFMISCVACILMHDQITHGRLFPLFGIHNFVQRVARYDLWFLCSVHLDARPNYARKVISPFRHSQFRATSCTLRFMIPV